MKLSITLVWLDKSHIFQNRRIGTERCLFFYAIKIVEVLLYNEQKLKWQLKYWVGCVHNSIEFRYGYNFYNG